MTDPNETSRVEVPISVNAEGVAYVRADWLVAHVRDWATQFENTPGPFLQRVTPAALLAHVATYLRREADALDVALIQHATENPRS